MESQTRSSSRAPPKSEQHDMSAEDVRRPRDGSRRRLGLAIVVTAALATGAAIVAAVYRSGGL